VIERLPDVAVRFRPPLPLAEGAYANAIFVTTTGPIEATVYFMRVTVPHASQPWKPGEMEVPLVSAVTMPRLVAIDLLRQLAESLGFEVREQPQPTVLPAPSPSGGN
jgi:hypothetical protein